MSEINKISGLCDNYGEQHIERYGVKLGRQKCRYCGAIIDVKKGSAGYAIWPRHQKKSVK